MNKLLGGIVIGALLTASVYGLVHMVMDDSSAPEIPQDILAQRRSGMMDLICELQLDLDGQLVEGTARQPLEYHIHSEIYRARPDVNAVMHTHPQWSTFLTMTGVKYQPVYAQGVLLGDIPLMDSPLSINTKAMGEKLVEILGPHPAVLLKAHGVVAVGADIVECFALAAYVEENAYRQYMAMQIGTPYVFSEAEQKASREKLWSASLFKKTWDHYRSKI